MKTPSDARIVITGIGIASPNGDNLDEFRTNLLEGVSGVENYTIRYFGDTVAGVCCFDVHKYQTRKQLRIGTRAGSVAVYCTREALTDSGIDLDGIDRSRVGVYLGITEHGNVETENEIHEMRQYGDDIKVWSHYHNPRTVANSPAGEVTIHLGITGPHYTIGGACAAGNAGLVQGCQQLLLGEVDIALCGGVSESIHTFGIFAGFKSQNALAEHEDPTRASRPFDRDRNGIVVSEGGAVYVLERMDRALERNAVIYGEILGYCLNSDAEDMVHPKSERQMECISKALTNAGREPCDVNIISTHATGTPAGDRQECRAIRNVFGENCADTYVNNTKSFVGHTMGAAGALELAGNLPSFRDRVVHPTINVEELDPECDLPNLVLNTPRQVGRVDTILNCSFGMVGINCAVVVGRFES